MHSQTVCVDGTQCDTQCAQSAVTMGISLTSATYALRTVKILSAVTLKQ